MLKVKIPNDVNKDLSKALKAFFKGKTLKSGNYFATKNALVYRTLSIVDGFNQDLLCLRLTQNGQDYYLGNSSRLIFCDTKIAFGQRTRKWGQSEPQRVLTRLGIPMLPFQSFIEAGLKITETQILDQTKSETVKRITGHKKDKPIFENVHFTGASLFKNKDKFFLFDIDRNEIQHGIFNPFICELGREARTVKEAYEGLVPDEVKQALSLGIKVLRQGEHYFIKQVKSDKFQPDTDINPFTEAVIYKAARLTVQGNRDHVASLFNEASGLVSGKVEHRGREHANLDISDGWYKPVPNTAAKSFTLTGDVD